MFVLIARFYTHTHTNCELNVLIVNKVFLIDSAREIFFLVAPLSDLL